MNKINSTILTFQVIALHFLKFTHLTWTIEWSHTLKPCPDGKCLATKHDQPFFGYQTFWCCIESFNSIKHVGINNMFYVIFDHMLDVVQILSNTIKKGVQPEKDLVSKQCLIVFYRQTFPILVELSIHVYIVVSFAASLLKSSLEQQKCVPWLFVNKCNQPNDMD